MKVAISDAGPLIHLAQIGFLDGIRNLFEEVFIPRIVYEEVVAKGLEREYPDAYIILDAVKRSWIKVKEAEIDIMFSGLHKGEAAAINLARRLKLPLLSDDSKARSIAKALNIEVHGSFWVVIENARRDFITRDKGERLLLKLASIMYVSSDILSFVLETLRRKK